MRQNFIAEKPKSWTTQLAELTLDETIDFAEEHARSIAAIISGKNRGGLRENYPHRKFKTKTIVALSVGGEETKVFRVKRVK